MAGRKPPSTNPGLWTLLLDKIGLSPSPKKGKKGKRRKGKAPGTQRLEGSTGDPALDAIINTPLPAAGEPSPFAQYNAESGMGFGDALGYEAAAAAGYAPPVPGAATAAHPGAAASATVPGATTTAAIPGTAGVPGFPAPKLEGSKAEGPAAPGAEVKGPTSSGPGSKASESASAPSLPFSAPPPAFPTDPGKLFNEDALDRSLDALFSGLEAGLTPPPASLIDDRPPYEHEVVHVPAPPPVTPPPAPAPVVADRPKPPPPIIPDPATTPPPAPVAATPPAPVFAAPSPIPTSGQAPQPGPVSPRGGQLPPPKRLDLSSNVDLRGLLAAIDRAPSVAGSMIVGYDGLIIVSTLPHDTRDYLGAAATSLFTGTGSQLEKMKRGELQRLLLESANGSMLMTSADMGILVVVSQDGQPMDVSAVLTSIAGALGLG